MYDSLKSVAIIFLFLVLLHIPSDGAEAQVGKSQPATISSIVLQLNSIIESLRQLQQANVSGADTSPPQITSSSPSGTLPAGTTQMTLRVNTNESAECRYSLSSGQSFGSMAPFENTGSSVSTQYFETPDNVDGITVNLYVKCRDNTGNVNASDYILNFTVEEAAEPEPVQCSSFTYSGWGTCSSAGSQSRSVVDESPNGCVGGSPVLTRSCTYSPGTPDPEPDPQPSPSPDPAPGPTPAPTQPANTPEQYGSYRGIPDPSEALGFDIEANYEVDQTFSGTYNNRQNYSCNGSASNPCFVDATNAVFNGLLQVSGRYVIFDGGLVDAPADRGYWVNFTGCDRCVVRDMEVSGPGQDVGHSAAIGMGNNSVWLRGKVHGFGDNRASAREQDFHGFKVQATSVWILDAEIYDNSGDSVQVGDATRGSGESVYIGGGYYHDNRENAVDIKDSRDIVVSGVRMSGFTPTNSSPGEAIIIHDDAYDARVYDNVISDSTIGIVSSGLSGHIIDGNNIDANTYGIDLRGTQNITVSNNNISAPTCLRTGGGLSGSIQSDCGGEVSVPTPSPTPSVPVPPPPPAPPVDVLPPLVTNGQPSTEQPVGTDRATISVQTNEIATCRYARTPNVTYNQMNSNLSASGNTHSANVISLENGTAYTYYIKCRDTEGNTSSDAIVAFSIASRAVDEVEEEVEDTTPVVTTPSSGGGGGGSSRDKNSFTQPLSNTNPSAGTDRIGAPLRDAGETVSVTTGFSYTFSDSDKVARGSERESVRWLQKALNRLGYTIAPSGDGAPGLETTYFGPATENALKRFQKDNGIVSFGDPESTGYGAFGPSTRRTLNEKLRSTTGPSNLSPAVQAKIAELLQLIAALQAILAERIAAGE